MRLNNNCLRHPQPRMCFITSFQLKYTLHHVTRLRRAPAAAAAALNLCGPTTVLCPPFPLKFKLFIIHDAVTGLFPRLDRIQRPRWCVFVDT